MRPLVVLALRALLILLALGALGAQIVLVVVLATQPDSEVATRGLFYSVLGVVVAIACVQVALVAVWALLSKVRRGAIFDERSFRWVDVIAVAGLVAALLVAAFCAHVGEIDDAPGLILIGMGIATAGVAFALLMVVMRGLLRNATVFRRELDEVV
ncbi:MAG: DUF2975 domain-containing protein [Pseudonocardia sp.]|nr:DUF2975 domain-containing protein [Pseudonocardia sp.]